MSYKFKHGNKEIEVPKKSESFCYQYDLGANVNLNTLTQEGYYHQPANVNATVVLNYPTAEAGLLTVINRGYVYQTYQTYCNSGFWYRSQYNGSWYAWKKSTDVNMLTWGNISGKPGSFIPSNHNHNYATWLGAQYVSGSEWIGFYNTYGGTRKGWIGHNDSVDFQITNEASGYIGINNNGGNGISLKVNGGIIYFEGNNKCFRPQGSDSGQYNLGMSYSKWAQVWASTGTIQTSDRDKKKDFKKFDQRYESFFEDLKPQLYRYKEGTSHRFHSGFISQEVEESLKRCGLNDTDFGGFCKDKAKIINNSTTNEEKYINKLDSDGNYIYDYSLRYEEFIALNTHMIQKQQSEIETLKKEVEQLKKFILNEK